MLLMYLRLKLDLKQKNKMMIGSGESKFSFIVDNNETGEKLKRGIEDVYNVVGSTLGPWGKTVIIQNEYNPPHVTKDGVTVANSIFATNQIERLGIEIFKQAARKTADAAGDGTTSTIVLARNLFINLEKYAKDKKTKTSSFISNLKALENFAIEVLKNKTKTINLDSEEELFNIAMVSSNGDEEISRTISKVFKTIGKFGVVTLDKSSTDETTIMMTEGLRWDKSHPSHLLRKLDGTPTIYKDPFILVTDFHINDTRDIEYLAKIQNQLEKPLVVICEDISEAALEVLVYKVNQNYQELSILRSPYLGQARIDGMVDFSIITGAKFLSKKEGYGIRDCDDLSHYGKADSVEIGLHDTFIIGRYGNQDKINDRIKYYQDKIKNDHLGPKSNYIERLGILTSGSCIINVGASTEAELQEKLDRYEDTIGAVKSALIGGFVDGGGLTYNQIAEEIRKNSKLLMREDFADSLETINQKIFENVDLEESIEIDLTKVIDPALVIENVIRNSCSVVKVLLTSEYSVVKDENHLHRSN